MAYTPKCKKDKIYSFFAGFSFVWWVWWVPVSSSEKLGQVPLTLVLLSNQVSVEAGLCVSLLFLLCDVILRALLCLGVQRAGLGQRAVGVGKNGHGEEWKEEGRGERNRERQNYRAVCKNQSKTCEAERWVCEPSRDEERQSFLFRETVSLLLTYTGDPELL